MLQRFSRAPVLIRTIAVCVVCIGLAIAVGAASEGSGSADGARVFG